MGVSSATAGQDDDEAAGVEQEGPDLQALRVTGWAWASPLHVALAQSAGVSTCMLSAAAPRGSGAGRLWIHMSIARGSAAHVTKGDTSVWCVQS